MFPAEMFPAFSREGLGTKLIRHDVQSHVSLEAKCEVLIWALCIIYCQTYIGKGIYSLGEGGEGGASALKAYGFPPMSYIVSMELFIVAWS